ncbi:MAG: 23S rRNA (pseudouridine(1915)-N(3))-methyltransferase RlmH [Oscillospiraceae bacterium]|jgi:23S rRNA (pseudouridine1915-N3)-methyltransferase|nr:23S rRNA (pseudouridine(1915)-N(3))-methyltransferase RlmH [Oscillospiraceae bacterium]
MIGLTFLCAGRVKEKHFADATAEYIKRLGAYCDVSFAEVREERTSENPSDAEISAALRREGAEILAKIPKGAFTIALCVEGKPLSTEEFAETLRTITLDHSKLCVVIGSSNGLSGDVKRAAQLRLSMSKMTLPHALARVMAAEQLYRAFNLLNGGKYHK